MKKIAIITSFPRMQRVDVYNEMYENNSFEFKVFYLRSMPFGRHWEYGPELEHEHILIKEKRIWKHFYFSPNLLKEFKLYNPDLMIMTQYASPGMQMLMYYCSIKNIPWIFWAETPHVRYEVPFIKNEIIRKYLRKLSMLPIKLWAKEVWGVGERAVIEYKNELGANKTYNNLPYFSNLDSYLKIHQKYNIDTVPTFLFSGSLSYRKGADLFIDALKTLADSDLKFNVIIIGKGEYSKYVSDIPKTDNISITYLGFVQLDEVPKVYEKANILVFPSRHDGWGMTLPEGMASGMAVITTREVGCAIDVIKDGDNGLFVNLDDKNSLTNLMRKLINEPDTVKNLGGKARQTIKEYTHYKGAEKFSSLIKDVLQ